MSIFTFDDEYTGPRWTYGVTIRPVARFNIPEGWIVDSQKENKKYRFGTVDYPFELSQDDLTHYDMIKEQTPNDNINHST